MEKVIIVGCGHVGLTLAADMETRKCKTMLEPYLLSFGGNPHVFRDSNFDDYHRYELHDIITNQSKVCLFPKSKIFFINDYDEEVVSSARLIIVTVPDIPRLRIDVLKWIKNIKSKNSLSIIFVRAGQGGQLFIMDNWRKDANLSLHDLVLIEDSFYGTRHCDFRIEFKRKRSTRVGVLSKNQEKVMKDISRLFFGCGDFHKFVQVSPLDLQFDPLGYIIHLAVAFDEKNLQLTKNNIQYLHYCEGVHAKNAALIESLDAERVFLAENYRAKTRYFKDILSEQYGIDTQGCFLDVMSRTRSIYKSKSCKSISELKDSRVINEDIPGLLTIKWLIDLFGMSITTNNEYFNFIESKMNYLGLDIDSYKAYIEYYEKNFSSSFDVINVLKGEWYGKCM